MLRRMTGIVWWLGEQRWTRRHGCRDVYLTLSLVVYKGWVGNIQWEGWLLEKSGFNFQYNVWANENRLNSTGNLPSKSECQGLELETVRPSEEIRPVFRGARTELYTDWRAFSSIWTTHLLNQDPAQLVTLYPSSTPAPQHSLICSSSLCCVMLRLLQEWSHTICKLSSQSSLSTMSWSASCLPVSITHTPDSLFTPSHKKLEFLFI